MSSHSSSVLISKYTRLLKEDPRSLVFAPLAECFRKKGEYQKAIHLLQKGLAMAPQYSVAQVCLAQVYIDLEQWANAYEILRYAAPTQRENSRMQILFAAICEKVEDWPQALETYKYLLYFHPKHGPWQEKVKELEEKQESLDSLVEDSFGPEKTGLSFGLLETYLLQNNWEKAKKMLDSFEFLGMGEHPELMALKSKYAHFIHHHCVQLEVKELSQILEEFRLLLTQEKFSYTSI